MRPVGDRGDGRRYGHRHRVGSASTTAPSTRWVSRAEPTLRLPGERPARSSSDNPPIADVPVGEPRRRTALRPAGAPARDPGRLDRRRSLARARRAVPRRDAISRPSCSRCSPARTSPTSRGSDASTTTSCSSTRSSGRAATPPCCASRARSAASALGTDGKARFARARSARRRTARGARRRRATSPARCATGRARELPELRQSRASRGDVAVRRGRRRHQRGVSRARSPGDRRQRRASTTSRAAPTSIRRRWWACSGSSNARLAVRRPRRCAMATGSCVLGKTRAGARRQRSGRCDHGLRGGARHPRRSRRGAGAPRPRLGVWSPSGSSTACTTAPTVASRSRSPRWRSPVRSASRWRSATRCAASRSRPRGSCSRVDPTVSSRGADASRSGGGAGRRRRRRRGRSARGRGAFDVGARDAADARGADAIPNVGAAPAARSVVELASAQLADSRGRGPGAGPAAACLEPRQHLRRGRRDRTVVGRRRGSRARAVARRDRRRR